MSTSDERFEHTYFLRGLDRPQVDDVKKRVPYTYGFREATLRYSASFIAMKCMPGSGREHLPEVAVCLQDVSLTLVEASYGVEQALVSLDYWSGKAGYEQVRIGQAQYYAADVAHRIYASGEHLSVAIMVLLGVPESALERKKQTSRQGKLRSYLMQHLPEDPITKAISTLGASAGFLRTLDYRGDWVHDQPQRVKGLGITYARNTKRWKPAKNAEGKIIGYRLGVGGGDPASASIESVIDDGIEAVKAMGTAAEVVMQCYDSTLAEAGIQRSEEGRGLTTTLF